MFRTIFSFIGALIGYVWSFISGPTTRIIIPVLLGGLFLFCIIFGFSFVVVYKEIFFVLFILITLGIWIPIIRPARNFLLAIWAVWFVFEVVFLGIVFPAIDNLVTRNNPAYAGFKKSSKELFVKRTEDSTISMKKEMMKSESNTGTFGEMKESSPAYDENGNIISDLFLKKGQKVMSLGIESKKQNDGSEGMAYVLISNEHGHFVKSPKALVPIRMIEWGPNGKTFGWEKVIEKKVVDFSQVEQFDIAHNQCIAKIPLSLKRLEEGNYRIKISGNWQLFMSNHSWTEFPWQGDNALGGKPEFRQEKKMNFGAIILLNNGENITPKTEEGFVISMNKDSDLSMRINILMRPDEFNSSVIRRPAFKNSTVNPLTITIEKEVRE
ncbi:MAG: hypothetical protein WC682_03905 [Parcubacteria group bacterium]|jgi:hypothetical protein